MGHSIEEKKLFQAKLYDIYSEILRLSKIQICKL